MRYFLHNQPVELTQADFKAQGGEGAVYVKEGLAYKIYRDPQRMIPPRKVHELAVLTRPNIISPLGVLTDPQGQAIGYAMPYIERAYPLCQTFPKAFRQRMGLTPEKALRLVRELADGVRYVHGKGLLIVDLNEMNLLAAHDFSDVYFLDVDSYQTPSCPATALAESVRDRHANGFNEGTDWFAFAIVSFQMFTGLHPYKGAYPSLNGLEARMRANVSVLHAGVSVPPVTLPLSVIPPAYLDWYRAVLEDGKRLPPPDGVLQIAECGLSAGAQRSVILPSGSLDVKLLGVYDADVWDYLSGATLTAQSIYQGVQRIASLPHPTARLALTKRGRVIVAYLDGRQLWLQDLAGGAAVRTMLEADVIATNAGRLYLKRGAALAEVELLELGARLMPALKPLGQVLPHAAQMFTGVVMQNLLGGYYASLLPSAGVCHQVRLPELDGFQILEAKLAGTVLMVLRARACVYDRVVFRFSDDFRSYDTRVIADIVPVGLNFITLDSGVCLCLTEDGTLEVFPRHIHTQGRKIISQPATLDNARLLSAGSNALLAQGRRLFQVKGN